MTENFSRNDDVTAQVANRDNLSEVEMAKIGNIKKETDQELTKESKEITAQIPQNASERASDFRHPTKDVETLRSLEQGYGKGIASVRVFAPEGGNRYREREDRSGEKLEVNAVIEVCPKFVKNGIQEKYYFVQESYGDFLRYNPATGKYFAQKENAAQDVYVTLEEGHLELQNLKEEKEQRDIASWNVAGYFGVEKGERYQWQQTCEELYQELGFDVPKFLSQYQEVIEKEFPEIKTDSRYGYIWENVQIVFQDHFEKIKKEIANAKEENNGSLDRMQWKLNEQLSDLFVSINNELLPTIKFYVEYQKGNFKPNLEGFGYIPGEKFKMAWEDHYTQEEYEEHVQKRIEQFERNFAHISFKNTYEVRTANIGGVSRSQKRKTYEDFIPGLIRAGQNPDALYASEHDLDGVIRGQFYGSPEKQQTIYQDFKTLDVDFNLLSEEDERIEAESMVAFLCGVGLQVAPYVGTAVSIPIDAEDIVSNTDATMSYLQKAGVADPRYNMPKYWYDNVFGVVGTIGNLSSILFTAGSTQPLVRLGTKGRQIAKAMKAVQKLPPGRVAKIVNTIAKRLGKGGDVIRMFFEKVLRLPTNRTQELLHHIDKVSAGRIDEIAEVEKTTGAQAAEKIRSITINNKPFIGQLTEGERAFFGISPDEDVITATKKIQQKLLDMGYGVRHDGQRIVDGDIGSDMAKSKTQESLDAWRKESNVFPRKYGLESKPLTADQRRVMDMPFEARKGLAEEIFKKHGIELTDADWAEIGKAHDHGAETIYLNKFGDPEYPVEVRLEKRDMILNALAKNHPEMTPRQQKDLANEILDKRIAGREDLYHLNEYDDLLDLEVDFYDMLDSYPIPEEKALLNGGFSVKEIDDFSTEKITDQEWVRGAIKMKKEGFSSDEIDLFPMEKITDQEWVRGAIKMKNGGFSADEIDLFLMEKIMDREWVKSVIKMKRGFWKRPIKNISSEDLMGSPLDLRSEILILEDIPREKLIDAQWRSPRIELGIGGFAWEDVEEFPTEKIMDAEWRVGAIEMKKGGFSGGEIEKISMETTRKANQENTVIYQLIEKLKTVTDKREHQSLREEFLHIDEGFPDTPLGNRIAEFVFQKKYDLGVPVFFTDAELHQAWDMKPAIGVPDLQDVFLIVRLQKQAHYQKVLESLPGDQWRYLGDVGFIKMYTDTYFSRDTQRILNAAMDDGSTLEKLKRDFPDQERLSEYYILRALSLNPEIASRYQNPLTEIVEVEKNIKDLIEQKKLKPLQKRSFKVRKLAEPFYIEQNRLDAWSGITVDRPRDDFKSSEVIKSIEFNLETSKLYEGSIRQSDDGGFMFEINGKPYTKDAFIAFFKSKGDGNAKIEGMLKGISSFLSQPKLNPKQQTKLKKQFHNILQAINDNAGSQITKADQKDLILTFFHTPLPGFQGRTVQEIFHRGNQQEILQLSDSKNIALGECFGIPPQGPAMDKLMKLFSSYQYQFPDVPESKLWESVQSIAKEKKSFEAGKQGFKDMVSYDISFRPKTFIDIAGVYKNGSCLGNDALGLGQNGVIIGRITHPKDGLVGSVVLQYDEKTQSLTIFDLEPSESLINRHGKDIKYFVEQVTESVLDFAEHNNLKLYVHHNSTYGNFSNKGGVVDAFTESYAVGRATWFDEDVEDYGEPVAINGYKYHKGKDISDRVKSVRFNREKVTKERNIKEAFAVAEKHKELPGQIIEQPVKTLDELYDLSEKSKADFDISITDFANEMGAEPKLCKTLKDRERADKKVLSFAKKGAKNPESMVLDINRASIVFENLTDLYAALPKFAEKFKIVNILDRFQNTPTSGYRDIKINIELPDKTIAEVQLHVKEILKNKDGLDTELYNIRRKFDERIEALDAIKKERNLTPEELKEYEENTQKSFEISAQQNKAYTKSWEPYEKEWESILSLIKISG